MLERGMVVQIHGTIRQFTTMHRLPTQLAEQQSLRC